MSGGTQQVARGEEAAGELAALAGRFDEERAYELVRLLADESLTGRQAGTSGHARACALLLERLTALGLAPTVQDFTVEGAALLSEAPTLSVDGRALEHRRHFAEHPRSANCPDPRTGTAREATAAGSGEWAVLSAVPQGAALDTLARELRGRGVLGLLTPQYADASGFLSKRLLGGATVALPVAAVRPDILSGLDGARISAAVPLRRARVTGRNILFGQRGPASAAPVIVLCAHYDGVGADPGRHFPAAGDNATGVAVLVEVARVCAERGAPDVPLLFAVVDAEELGAQGSRAHAAALRSAGTPAVALNLDMAGRWNGTVAVELGQGSEVLYDALDAAGLALGIPLAGAPVSSDNRSYAAAGFPAAGLGLGAAHYHSPLDSLEHVDPTALGLAGRLLLGTVHQLSHPRSPTEGNPQ